MTDRRGRERDIPFLVGDIGGTNARFALVAPTRKLLAPTTCLLISMTSKRSTG
jgi:glucokinase